jgi:hypothetical protein
MSLLAALTFPKSELYNTVHSEALAGAGPRVTGLRQASPA